MIRGFAALVCFCWSISPVAVKAGDPAERRSSLFVQTSLYTEHFRPSPEHVDRQNLLGLEYNHAGGWLLGGAYFENSFGQPSQYLYVGKKFVLSQFTRHLYGKLTGGLAHGYKHEHEDAIPFNQYGVAPVVIPSLGLQFGGFGTELVVFGTSGYMINAGWNFPLGGKKSD